jgi:uncharacterized protein
MTDSTPPFHLAFPVTDIEATRRFYVDLLGCREGRSAERWIDFDFHGHQLVAHLVPAEAMGPAFRNPVDGEAVPAFHFGVVLDWPAWQSLAERLSVAQVSYLVEPTVRFPGRVGEQGTFFVRDPSGNALEFKAFRDRAMLFAKDVETYR